MSPLSTHPYINHKFIGCSFNLNVKLRCAASHQNRCLFSVFRIQLKKTTQKHQKLHPAQQKTFLINCYHCWIYSLYHIIDLKMEELLNETVNQDELQVRTPLWLSSISLCNNSFDNILWAICRSRTDGSFMYQIVRQLTSLEICSNNNNCNGKQMFTPNLG